METNFRSDYFLSFFKCLYPNFLELFFFWKNVTRCMNVDFKKTKYCGYKIFFENRLTSIVNIRGNKNNQKVKFVSVSRCCWVNDVMIRLRHQANERVREASDTGCLGTTQQQGLRTYPLRIQFCFYSIPEVFSHLNFSAEKIWIWERGILDGSPKWDCQFFRLSLSQFTNRSSSNWLMLCKDKQQKMNWIYQFEFTESKE